MNRAVNRKIIRFTLAFRRSLSLVINGDDFNVILVLLVLVLLLVVLVGQPVHSRSVISHLRCCLNDIVELGDGLWVLGCKLLRSLLILVPLLEGHDDPIFTHIRDRVTDLTKLVDELLKVLIGLLDASK
jgi:hypothetical protein